MCEPGECMGLGPATGSRCRREEARARRDAGAGVQPSAEAIEAAAKMMKAGEAQGHSIAARAHDVAFATLRVDAPAIAREAHAAGVAEGRAAMRDEIRSWARCQLPQHYDNARLGDQIADLIEARFPSEGTT